MSVTFTPLPQKQIATNLKAAGLDPFAAELAAAQVYDSPKAPTPAPAPAPVPTPGPSTTTTTTTPAPTLASGFADTTPSTTTGAPSVKKSLLLDPLVWFGALFTVLILFKLLKRK